MTPATEIKTKLETIQAKEWGFKSIKDAERNGYNVTTTSVTVNEVAKLLDISITKVRVLFNIWRNNNKGYYTTVADLDCFYFNF